MTDAGAWPVTLPGETSPARAGGPALSWDADVPAFPDAEEAPVDPHPYQPDAPTQAAAAQPPEAEPAEDSRPAEQWDEAAGQWVVPSYWDAESQQQVPPCRFIESSDRWVYDGEQDPVTPAEPQSESQPVLAPQAEPPAPAVTLAPPVPAATPPAPRVPEPTYAAPMPLTAVPEPQQRRQDPFPPAAPTWPAPTVLPTGSRAPVTLDDESLLRGRKSVPTSGLRATVHKMTGGLVNLGPSQAQKAREAQERAIRTPVTGFFAIASISTKGGVGKTTVASALGSTLASVRGDHIIAVDANPDAGTLANRLTRETGLTVRDLLNELDSVRNYGDVRRFTSQAPSRLEVLASAQDPAQAEAFNEDDYRSTLDVLKTFYQVVLADSGTGMTHSAMNGILGTANTVIVVANYSVDAANSASQTLDWLSAHGYQQLVANSVAVVVNNRGGKPDIDAKSIVEHFKARCRAVVEIPFDKHLAQGAVIDLTALRPATASAFRDLAAVVAGQFSAPPPPHG